MVAGRQRERRHDFSKSVIRIDAQPHPDHTRVMTNQGAFTPTMAAHVRVTAGETKIDRLLRRE
jgi:hypothetical protein